MHIDLNILSKHSNLAFEWFYQSFYCKENVNEHNILQNIRKWLFPSRDILDSQNSTEDNLLNFWWCRVRFILINFAVNSSFRSNSLHFKIVSLFIHILIEFFIKILGKGMDEICKMSWKRRNERTNESLLLENGTFKIRNTYIWHIFSKNSKKSWIIYF